MKLIELTQQQEQQLTEFRQYCLDKGLSVEKINMKTVVGLINDAYKIIGKKPPKVWYCESPLIAILLINLWDNLWDNLRANLRANLWANLGDNLWANLWDNLKIKFISTKFWGNMEIYWVAFYLYAENFLGIKYKKEDSERLNLMFSISENMGWWYPYENICFVCDRPKEIHKKGIRLHADGKPALLFRDGYCLWYLNGVKMPKNIVMTKAQDLDPKLIITEKNAEVRREIVRKIGIEGVCRKLGAKTLDKGIDHAGNPCELLTLNINDGRNRPYIKLINPSIGVYHLEGVSPDCDTLQKAWNFRNGTDEKPIILT